MFLPAKMIHRLDRLCIQFFNSGGEDKLSSELCEEYASSGDDARITKPRTIMVMLKRMYRLRLKLKQLGQYDAYRQGVDLNLSLPLSLNKKQSG